MIDPVIDWLLDSDPAIRWQVMRDLLDEPEPIWLEERRRIEHEGWGARLLALQDADGQWAAGALMPADFSMEHWKSEGQPWTATAFTLQQLREFGLDPASERARRTVELVGRNSRWDHDGQPYWDGEVEECINGRTVADGAYFGVDISAIVKRLLGERQPDGGWNCQRAAGSKRSSFDTTINVLEGLLEYQKMTDGSAAVIEARRSGEAYLLQRHLFRRLGTGEVVDARFLSLTYPTRWRHDILRGLDYFRAASVIDGNRPDERLAEAVALLQAKQGADGRWPLDWEMRGRTWFRIDDEPGEPSRWVTLKALRVLKWWDSRAETA